MKNILTKLNIKHLSLATKKAIVFALVFTLLLPLGSFAYGDNESATYDTGDVYGGNPEPPPYGGGNGDGGTGDDDDDDDLYGNNGSGGDPNDIDPDYDKDPDDDDYEDGDGSGDYEDKDGDDGYDDYGDSDDTDIDYEGNDDADTDIDIDPDCEPNCDCPECEYVYDEYDKDKEEYEEYDELLINFDDPIEIYAFELFEELYEDKDIEAFLLQGVTVSNEEGEYFLDLAQIYNDDGFAEFVEELLIAFECETGETELPEMPFEAYVTYYITHPESGDIIVSEPRSLRVKSLEIVAIDASNVQNQDELRLALATGETEIIIRASFEITSDPGPNHPTTGDPIPGGPIIITGNVTIRGEGGVHTLSIPLEVDRNERFRHFYVRDGTFDLGHGLILTRASNRNMCAGGIQVGDAGIFNMRGSEISGNRWRTDGGGVRAYGTGIFNMYDGVIHNNYAAFGGGFSLHGGGEVYIQGGTISNNRAVGTAYFENPDPNFGDHEGNGGGFWIGEAGVLRIGNNTTITTDIIIRGNTASNVGGGIFTTENRSVVEITRGLFEGNVANRGGAIYTANPFISIDTNDPRPEGPYRQNVGIGLIGEQAVFRLNFAHDGFCPAFPLTDVGLFAGFQRFHQLIWQNAGGDAWNQPTNVSTSYGLITGTSLNEGHINTQSDFYPNNDLPLFVHLINNYDIYGAGFPENEVLPDWARLRKWIEDEIGDDDATIYIFPHGSTLEDGTPRAERWDDGFLYFVLQDDRRTSVTIPEVDERYIFYANATAADFGRAETNIEISGDITFAQPTNGTDNIIFHRHDVAGNAPGRHFDVLGGGSLTFGGSSSRHFILDGNRSERTGGASGGIIIREGGSVEAEHTIFRKNLALNGGAIENYGSLEIEGGTIENNTATSSGGGIFVSDNANLSIFGATFITSNRANGEAVAAHPGHTDGGGGIFISGNVARDEISIGHTVDFTANYAVTGWVPNPLPRNALTNIQWLEDHSVVQSVIILAPSSVHLLNNFDINYNPRNQGRQIHFGSWDMAAWLRTPAQDAIIALGDWDNSFDFVNGNGVPTTGWGNATYLPQYFTPIAAAVDTTQLQVRAEQPSGSSDELYRLLHRRNGNGNGNGNSNGGNGYYGNGTTTFMEPLGGPGRTISIPRPNNRQFTWEDIDIVVYRGEGTNFSPHGPLPTIATAEVTWSLINGPLGD